MRLQITGTMSDGSPAPQEILKTATYKLEDPTIADIIGGEIIPKISGTTKVFVNIDGVITIFEITVVIDKVFDRLSINPRTITLSVGSLINISIV